MLYIFLRINFKHFLSWYIDHKYEVEYASSSTCLPSKASRQALYNTSGKLIQRCDVVVPHGCSGAAAVTLLRAAVSQQEVDESTRLRSAGLARTAHTMRRSRQRQTSAPVLVQRFHIRIVLKL